MARATGSGMASLRLPPTPTDLEAVEEAQRLLVHIRRSTELLVSLVADHAFGASPSICRQIHERIGSTAELCRRCEHAVARCDARAAAAAGRQHADLRADAAAALRAFDDVAAAAASAAAQLSLSPRTPPPPAEARGGEELRRNWAELLALPPSADARRAPRHPSAAAAAAAVAAARPAPSDALSLWSARQEAEEPRAAAAAGRADRGAFASLEQERPAPSPAAAVPRGKARERRRASLRLLRSHTAELYALLDASVWGFSAAARARLGSIELEGRAAARECRAGLAAPEEAKAEAKGEAREEAREEVERCIQEFGTLVELAHHVAAQHEQSEAELRRAAAEGGGGEGGREGGGGEAKGVAAPYVRPSGSSRAGAESTASAAEGGAARGRAPARREGEAARREARPQERKAGGAPLPPPREATTHVVAAMDSDVQLQAQLHLQPLVASAIKQNEQIIEENERAMETIAHEVQEIHSIFSELDTIVAAQSRDVENVSTAAALAYHAADSALVELEHAAAENKPCSVQ